VRSLQSVERSLIKSRLRISKIPFSISDNVTIELSVDLLYVITVERPISKFLVKPGPTDGQIHTNGLLW